MFYYYPYFFGMNAVWWVVWIVALVLLFSFAVPVRRKIWREYRLANPFAVLQRRYAAGEISTEEYEERRSMLARDLLTNARGKHSINTPIGGKPYSA
jgi:putative membrane protein